MPAKSLELRHTIKLIRELDAEIAEIEAEIKSIMDELQSPILTIPGISYRMGAMISLKSETSLVLTHQTRFWPMQGCHLLHTSPDN
ncbi:MAG: hypothetical protein ABFC57_14960 [Veillonellales bacterium]